MYGGKLAATDEETDESLQQIINTPIEDLYSNPIIDLTGVINEVIEPGEHSLLGNLLMQMEPAAGVGAVAGIQQPNWKLDQPQQPTMPSEVLKPNRELDRTQQSKKFFQSPEPNQELDEPPQVKFFRQLLEPNLDLNQLQQLMNTYTSMATKFKWNMIQLARPELPEASVALGPLWESLQLKNPKQAEASPQIVMREVLVQKRPENNHVHPTNIPSQPPANRTPAMKGADLGIDTLICENRENPQKTPPTNESAANDEWVTDEFIGSAMRHLENSPLCKKFRDDIALIDGTVSLMVRFSDLVDTVSLVNALSLNDKRYWAIAVNDNDDPARAGGTHWSLLTFKRDELCFTFYDSMNPTISEASALAAEQISSKLAEILHFNTLMEFRVARCARQQNGHDCGIYAMEFLRIFLKKIADPNCEDDYEALTPQIITSRRIQWTKLIKLNDRATK